MLATGVIAVCIVGANRDGLRGRLQAKHTVACPALAAPHSSQKNESEESICPALSFMYVYISIYAYTR